MEALLSKATRSCPFLASHSPATLRMMSTTSSSSSSSSSSEATAGMMMNACPHMMATLSAATTESVQPDHGSNKRTALFLAAQGCPVMGRALAVQLMKTTRRYYATDAISTSSSSSISTRLLTRLIASSPKKQMASAVSPTQTVLPNDVPPFARKPSRFDQPVKPTGLCWLHYSTSV
jgi:hypothetical protein